jgi:hypothetical protein
MRRDQLEHAIRTACQIIERPEVIVVGSQAILGSFREDELPADATMSVEVDILAIADSNDETARLVRSGCSPVSAANASRCARRVGHVGSLVSEGTIWSAWLSSI